MKLIICENYDQVSEKAADFIHAQITLKPDSVLGLATGSTPIGTYEILIDRYKKGRIDFSDAVTFNLDEYIGLEKTNKNSYYSFMHENFFDHINIKPENIHIPDGNSDDIEKTSEEYDMAIEKAGYIDLQILGIGQNAHIGFNEPDTSFSKKTGVVQLTDSTIKANSRFFKNIEEVPTKAISMGTGSIFKAKMIILLATGEKKAKAVHDMILGDITPEVPASVLQLHSNVVVIVDKEAAKLLNDDLKNF